MATQEKKFHQAALTYLFYGLLYWAGGYYLIEQGVSQQDGKLWILIGGLFILVFPPLIWYGATRTGLLWFTRFLAVFVFIRVLGLARVMLNDTGTMIPLPWEGDLPLLYGAGVFLLVAAVTCWMLARAGWNIGAPKRDEASAS